MILITNGIYISTYSYEIELEAYCDFQTYQLICTFYSEFHNFTTNRMNLGVIPRIEGRGFSVPQSHKLHTTIGIHYLASPMDIYYHNLSFPTRHVYLITFICLRYPSNIYIESF